MGLEKGEGLSRGPGDAPGVPHGPVGDPNAVDVAVGMVVRTVKKGGVAASEVLLTLRRKDQVLAGLWEFPGGKVEPGESHAACVGRELQEEVGLPVTVLETWAPVGHTYGHATVSLTPCLCQVAQQEDAAMATSEPQALEVDDVRWVPISALPEMALPVANGPLVAQLIQRFAPENRGVAKG